MPAALMETFCCASSYDFGQCCSVAAEEYALAAQTEVRGCRLHGSAAGSAGGSAESLALPQHTSSGTWGHFTPSAASSPALPTHPSPSCGTASLRAGMTQLLLCSPDFHPVFAPQRKKTLLIILSAASSATPGRDERRGEKRDPRPVLVLVWGGGAIAISADGLRREVLYSTLSLGHEFLSPSPAAICHTQLVNCGYNRFYS